MKGSMFVFASDLLGEGIQRVVANIQERAMLQAITLACTYHSSRALFPHQPVHKVLTFDEEIFFRPQAHLFQGLTIQPPVSASVKEKDPLEMLLAIADKSGLEVHAWTTCMHSDRLGIFYPDCTVKNVFGDMYSSCLCPAHPDVRAYVCAIVSNLAHYPVRAILLETASYMPLAHGAHHERFFVPLSPLARWVLSLCFCRHCVKAAQRKGVDVHHLQQWCQRELTNTLHGEPSVLDEYGWQLGALLPLADGMLAAYIMVRQSTVTSLVAQLCQSVKRYSNAAVIFMDMSGSFALQEPLPSFLGWKNVPERAWQDGVDLPRVAQACDGLAVLGYTQEAKSLRSLLTAYHRLAKEIPSFSVVLRPMPPDSSTPEELLTRMRIVRRVEPEWVAFYHYGFMRLSNLDWIGQAMRS